MTSPTTFNTVGRVIQVAYESAGLVADGSNPNSEQLARGINRLNSLVNYFQTKGLKLFTLVDTAVTLVSGTSMYSIGPGAAGLSMTKPLRALWGYFLSSGGSRTPLTLVSWQEIVQLQTANNTGQPCNFFVDKQVANLAVTVWPTPDATSATGSLHLVFQTQIANTTGLTDQTSFPAEWFLALMWGLADEICTGQPQEIVQRCAAKAERYRTDAENWDVEDAPTFFTPDTRGGMYGNSFS